MNAEMQLVPDSSQLLISLTGSTNNIRLMYGPLPLELKLDGACLCFPPGTDYVFALQEAATGFWKALDQSAPGWHLVDTERRNPTDADSEASV